MNLLSIKIIREIKKMFLKKSIILNLQYQIFYKKYKYNKLIIMKVVHKTLKKKLIQ